MDAIEPSKRDEPGSRDDFLAGWLGGAVGILVSNPLEVLKVRLQTARVPSSRVGAGSRSTASSTPSPSTTSSSSPSTSSSANSAKPTPTPRVAHIKPGLATLWKSEGLKFLFAGAAGPIMGLAVIDSAFFGGYGLVMHHLEQDRQNPSMLSRVFLAGATSGATCALLQTPIEVVKCRAQAESFGKDGKKLGSFKISQKIWQTDGPRGFYIGGLMTACRDGISSGIFFWGYFVFRRLLRGQEAFKPSPPSLASSSSTSADAPSIPGSAFFQGGKLNKTEVGRTLLAGGLAGSLSAIVPYPFDIIKTRLQTSIVDLRAHPSPSSSSPFSPSGPSTPTPLTVRHVAHGIHSDGMASFRYRFHETFVYSFLNRFVFPPARGDAKCVDGRWVPKVDPRAESWAVRLLGLKGFLRGLKPTVASSFVGSAVTITTFEIALVMLSGHTGGDG